MFTVYLSKQKNQLTDSSSKGTCLNLNTRLSFIHCVCTFPANSTSDDCNHANSISSALLHSSSYNSVQTSLFI